MKTYEQKIEIPFGAKDSELQEWTYTIPEGMEAEIKNGKVIIKRKESEDERIRKDLIKYLESDRDCQPCQDVSFYDSSIAWLEKHKDSVSNAKYIEDVAHAFEDGRKKGIEEKQKEQKPVEWSEEDGKEFNDTLYDGFNAFEDGFNKGYELGKHDLAMEFLNYLDKNCPEGKMCVSNGECEDIDKAFKENDWAKIIRYAKKYQIQSEQKPEVKLTGWVARDRNGEIWVYGAYPEKNSERQIWTESSCMPLNRKSFPDLKWEDEPMEVEITIRKNNTL